MSKKPSFRGPFDKWHAKRAETLLKSERHHLYHIYWSLFRQFSWKKSALVICKILRLLFNPLTPDDKYSLLNRDNLLQHFQMQLSQKRKVLAQSFFPISKFRFNFKDLKKKDHPHNWCFSKFMVSGKRG